MRLEELLELLNALYTSATTAPVEIEIDGALYEIVGVEYSSGYVRIHVDEGPQEDQDHHDEDPEEGQGPL